MASGPLRTPSVSKPLARGRRRWLAGCLSSSLLATSALADCAKPLYLTFDTGHMGVAPLIAQVLQRQQVRVTFFAAHEPTQEGDGSLGEHWAAWWRARAPPSSPVLTQAAITLLGGLMGGKKGDPHLLALQHLGNQGGHAHVAGVKSEVQRLGTVGQRRCGQQAAAQAAGQPAPAPSGERLTDAWRAQGSRCHVVICPP